MSLTVTRLSVALDGRAILHDINMEVASGTLHALMGPNGSGKSTFAAALMGDGKYEVKSQTSNIKINGTNILELSTDARAREGLFLAFQNPVAVPGVSVANLLRTAYQQRQADRKQKPASVIAFNTDLLAKATGLGIKKEFLGRSLNEEFSGGEKKKLEMLQAMVLSPKYAVFDEIDTGLDVDALKVVASAMNELKKQGTGIVVITHYQRILRHVKPDKVYILVGGTIVASGDASLAQEVEKEGYKRWLT